MMHGEGATVPLLEREDESAWAGMAERGSLRALRFIRWVYRTFGRRATIAFLTPVVAYFFVTGRGTRRASLDYLRTLWAAPGGGEALGAPPTLRDAFRHLHEFAEQVVDRMIVWSGDTEIIEIDYKVPEILPDVS